MAENVGIGLPDLPGLQFRDLEQVVDLRITGSAAAVDHLVHPSIFVWLAFTRLQHPVDVDDWLPSKQSVDGSNPSGGVSDSKGSWR